MPPAHCAIHKGQKLICPLCNASKGGKSKSRLKAQASVRNGKRGGRPKNS
jgi:hypothetical protein